MGHVSEQFLFLILDLVGTFAFAVSGVVAARQKSLDIFGIGVIAFITSCGGGIIRDICLGATPPAGLTNWHYLVTAIVAALLSVFLYDQIAKLKHPVLFFDALGLGFFAVSGAQKSLLLGSNAELAILLGMITACGGGALRDVLLARVPVILKKEIYASAALLASSLVVLGEYMNWPNFLKIWMPLLICIGLRGLSIKYKLNLPSFPEKKSTENTLN